jgi:hypothetical protein
LIVFHAKPLLISSNLNWQYESHLNNPNLLGSISKSGLFRPLFKSDSLKLNSKQLLFLSTITGIPFKEASRATWLLNAIIIEAFWRSSSSETF